MRFSLRKSWIFAFGIFLEACLEAPGAPSIVESSPQFFVCAAGNGSPCNADLQVSPADSFSVKVRTFPDSLQKKLRFLWTRIPSEILFEGNEFSTDTSRVPDSLVIADAEGNRYVRALTFVFDTAPRISETVPADGDTLRGNFSTAFRFAYSAIDDDPGDTLRYTVFLDSVEFGVGTITEFFQSGFSPGTHTFQVLVSDRFGLGDSTPKIRFFVAEVEP